MSQISSPKKRKKERRKLLKKTREAGEIDKYAGLIIPESLKMVERGIPDRYCSFDCDIRISRTGISASPLLGLTLSKCCFFLTIFHTHKKKNSIR